MSEERLNYVDWLKVSVILSLVPYHSALTYTGLGDTYIKVPLEDARILPFLVITAPLDNFFMTLLFFLSGVSTYYALKNKSKEEYIKDRVRKLLVPFVLGTVLLCPMQAYFKGLNEGFQGNYLEFIPEFFSSKIVDYLGYAHLWFLLYLFIFSVICLPLFKKWQNNKARLDKITSFLCRDLNIYMPIIFIIIVETLLRPLFPGKQILIMDWANDIVYSSVFIFGFVFAHDSKLQERLDSIMKTSMVIVGLCLAIFYPICYSWAVYHSTAVFLSFLWAFAKGAYECFAIILLVGAGRRYFNKKSTVLGYLSKASFTYYIMHFLPVSAFTYVFLKVNLNVYVKYLSVLIISYASLFVAYEFLVRRILYKKQQKLPTKTEDSIN